MPSETVQQLRQQLREKFPAAHRERNAGIMPTPFSAPPDVADTEPPSSTSHFSLLTRHFPSGAITEISPAHPACGLTLLFAALLSEADSESQDPQSEIPNPRSPLVLIDARDRFDPSSFSPEACQRLLWLRCRETQQALQSADLLLRDGNLPFVLLDLSPLPARELRRIPTSVWHRLRQLAETSKCTLLTLTPTPLVPRAALRLTLSHEFKLQDLDLPRTQLAQELHVRTTHQQAHIA